MAKKTHTTTIKSREELEAVMGEYAAQVLERDRLTVEMEQRIAAIRAEYELPIAACVKYGDGLFEDMNAWAVLHPGEFGVKKSIDLLHGRIGFRTCSPAVKQVPGVKVDHSVELLLAGAANLVRTKFEIDKETILVGVNSGEITEENLKPFGLRIERSETFYTDVKREDGKGAQ
ncbi:MAG TPA: host-nuclease inhibitor Gam family protein [Kiritimatiellia bacterium]|nr:host-nuclease inhibitor Gam family protein [Kiritimatiellia bacterium]